jgi:hypothetical protein
LSNWRLRGGNAHAGRGAAETFNRVRTAGALVALSCSAYELRDNAGAFGCDADPGDSFGDEDRLSQTVLGERRHRVIDLSLRTFCRHPKLMRRHRIMNVAAGQEMQRQENTDQVRIIDHTS